MRITRQPIGKIDGITLDRYHLGQTYDVPALIADYLVLQGYAVSEMRRHQRSHRKRPTDRRRQTH